MCGLINILNFYFWDWYSKITKHFVCLKSAISKLSCKKIYSGQLMEKQALLGSVEITNIHNHLQIFVPERQKKKRLKLE